MGQVRLADLPSTSKIDPESYVVIERPGIGEGTFKSTVEDLQKAITVTATVTRQDDKVHIYINDINGTTEEDIILPTADVSRSGKETTIRIHDWRGTTEEVVIVPTANITRAGQILTIELTDEDHTTTEDIFIPLATVFRENNIIRFQVTDEKGTTSENIVLPTATIEDNGDNTAVIKLTDAFGETQLTIVSRVILDDEPTPDSPNMLTSGTIYNLISQTSEHIDEVENRLADTIDSLEDARARIDELETRLARLEAASTRDLTIEDDQYIEGEPAFMSEGESYQTLEEAILGTAKKGGTVTLLSDGTSSGVPVPSGSNFTLDLNGHTLNVTGPGTGSPGTQTLGMQLLKDSDIVIKNGSLVFNDLSLKMGIQNYSNLTLDNVQVFGGITIQYVVSNNFGNVTFKNGTTITASGGNVAFDAWYGMAAVYDSGVKITIEDETVQINGKVEFGKANRASLPSFAQNAWIKCPKDMELNTSILTPPCEWYNEGDMKVLKYSGA